MTIQTIKTSVDNFTEKYLELKSKGLTDHEAAKALYIGLSTLRRYKKQLGITGIKAPMPNKQGVTQEQLAQAEKNGLTREIVLRRVRAYGWEVETAIVKDKIPLDKRRLSRN